jgi:hypothetical protein
LGGVIDIVIWEVLSKELYTTSEYCMKLLLFFFMMAGDKNSKDSGTDINKNEPLKFFFSMIIQTFQLFVYKNNTFVCLGKNSPFVFKTTTLFLYMCSQLLF